MSSVEEVERQIHDMVSGLVESGVLSEQFFELVELQDAQNPNFLVELVDIFFRTANEKVDQMETLLRTTPVDMAELDAHVHKLKGSSASFGAKTVADICHAMKDALPNRNVGELQDLVLQHRRALHTLRDRLQELLRLDARKKELLRGG